MAPRAWRLNRTEEVRCDPAPIHEVADGIYRISTPVAVGVGGFTFNQYLAVDDEPLLFHTGPRGLFPQTREAIETVIPVARLRHIAFSHFESDECGALNQLLAAAPQAQPVCGRINALINGDSFDRPPRALGDGEWLPACTGAPGGATAPPCCAPSRPPWRRAGPPTPSRAGSRWAKSRGRSRGAWTGPRRSPASSAPLAPRATS